VTVVPIVAYLSVETGEPRLVSNECLDCRARFFDARMACAKCGKREFRRVAHPPLGTVESFTIVHRAAEGVPTPYISAVVRLEDGTAVKANVIGCVPDLNHVRLHMPVQLRTFIAGTDDRGTEAVAFGFVEA
jgi:uncharacterized OB-fold protein